MHQISLVLLIALSVITSSVPDIRLGDPMPIGAKDTGERILVSPGQTQNHWVLLLDSIEYSLGVDNDGLVQYISTYSTSVSTPEGVHVGQSLAEIVQLEGVKVFKWPGWGFVAKLPSGWKAAFYPDSTAEDWFPSIEDWEPQPEEKVDQLFLGTAAGYGAGKK